MPQATKRTRQVLTIAVPAAGSGGGTKVGKKKAARLTKVLKKVAKAADEAGLEVTSDLGALKETDPKAGDSAKAGAAAKPGGVPGAGGTPKAAKEKVERPVAPTAAEPGETAPPVTPAAAGAPAPAKRAARKRTASGKAATAAATSAEPSAAAAGEKSTATPAPPRRALRRTPARPPVRS